MLSIRNDKLGLYCLESGKALSIVDYQSGETWTLDENTLVYGQVDNFDGRKADLLPMAAGSAEKLGDDKMRLTYKAGQNQVTMEYSLLNDCLEVVLPATISGEIGIVSFPGSFQPADGNKKYILPIMQGMLWDGKGEPFNTRYTEAWHGGFTMAMFGVLGQKGGLLCAAETFDDCLWWVGKSQEGRTWATNLQVDSLGTMRYDRKIRLYPTKPDITALAKTYRNRIIERGRFVSWEEKIKERPALKRLFGTIMCFIGYCQDDIDYVRECEKLKAYGFDKALLYPVRFNTYSKDFKMGGFPPIYLDRDVISRIKEIGYDVAPWTWINEGLDDGSEEMYKRYRRDRNGDLMISW